MESMVLEANIIYIETIQLKRYKKIFTLKLELFVKTKTNKSISSINLLHGKLYNFHISFNRNKIPQ